MSRLINLSRRSWIPGIVFLSACAPAPDRIGLADVSRTFIEAAREVQPAVPQIVVTRLVEIHDPFQDFFDDFFQRFFGEDRPRRIGRRTSLGSGVVINSGGLILTNAHVVRGADEIQVRMPDGREFTTRKFQAHERVDMAVVQVEASGLPVARLGDSDALEVGQWVLAIGNPFGFSHTVTAGIVSATRRGEKEGGAGFIQTDAAINPGNSGGPLVDLQGRVVGLNTAIYSQTGGYQGVGFALPINLVKQLMRAMK
ncbi:MAG: trypsin-like peptidase domain-containing protein [Planctomycetes bacterium]|nr:trypsin-like peptidase domain-containing protein [Planctomycetota bacterium]